MTPAVPADLLGAVRDELARSGAEVEPQQVARALRLGGRPVGDAEVLAVHDALRRDVLGAGPLDDLLALPGVTDVLVNGPEEVWIERDQGLERTDVRFADEESVRRLAQRLAAAGGRRLDDGSPYVDLRLADGTRFHAVLAPLARPGTVISLRVPSRRGFDLAAIGASGAISPDGERVLRRIVAARLAFLVSGGTGTGKTTLLGALLGVVGPGERLVLVEDSSELRPAHPHVVGLEARPANLEGAGEVTVRTLVRQALRMRPDRLVVGEVRGAEVVDLLAAMNTGHEGGCGTLHANSATDVPARIESLAMAAGLSREAAASQLGSAVDVVIHLDRADSGRRAVREIAVLDRVAGAVEVRTALRFGAGGVAELGPGAARLDELLLR
ncbi:MAG: TadA family conjugal transfer-associated ATPase [Propionibacteriales bacterium]|nr:TadA family conjugal transfer-associated ATPase [Propionibacteriales bacterium]